MQKEIQEEEEQERLEEMDEKRLEEVEEEKLEESMVCRLVTAQRLSGRKGLTTNCPASAGLPFTHATLYAANEGQSNGHSEAAIYHIKGICSYKDKFFKPGESFRRGCDKCFCHNFGVYCVTPMKPTSWPRKCQRIRTECGYTVVYKENPQAECRAYSWIG
ncbi:hypothetical protein D5F01_LYC08224 [Larimichthys crocea]|uniref:Beta-microseminoprotein n=1 Tax=Larimichthys crocea TaxID=215358 RepID=A0A6G0IPE0_LARCR|nr:hypothetical protein D5F01_LYC08224 [Larimichthys crocea]